ncbi:hypothetical protein COV18_07315 [Candidatus Woesearchaeota archaeon CG10_big_fil_rev_8_21_14_0_10_37_12]|nr:MAG: hypothetical protein COV18_07315 [Candidatus Woesearchaeota archaeon CG10_big_fil_rev_8_21_14_0_10_37_12]
MIDKSLFLQVLGNSPLNRVLDFLIVFKDFDYSLTDISENANVAWSTLHLFWNDLERHHLVHQTRTVGKAKMYKLNNTNPVVKQLIKVHYLIAKEYADKKLRKIMV